MVIQNKKRYDGSVLNLATGEFLHYSRSLDPREAVIAAYAQDKGDWNTWLYSEKYGDKVLETNLCFICGDFTTFKE
jgi:hypothetical protein